MSTSPFLTPTSESPRRQTRLAAGFASTQWSVVLSAAKSGSDGSRAALATLCGAYWQPLYGYVRRTGRSREDAEDLVQGFFSGFLEKNALQDVDPERGRFRAFLLACLKHYMCNEWNRGRRQKRGGNATVLSLDWTDAEARYRLEPVETLSPDRIYDREWALTLIDRVLTRLREEREKEDKADQFDALKEYLTFDRADIPHERAAEAMNMSVGAVRVMVHRFRKRYRTLLREEVARTLASRDQLDDEMNALFVALSG